MERFQIPVSTPVVNGISQKPVKRYILCDIEQNIKAAEQQNFPQDFSQDFMEFAVDLNCMRHCVLNAKNSIQVKWVIARMYPWVFKSEMYRKNSAISILWCANWVGSPVITRTQSYRCPLKVFYCSLLWEEAQSIYKALDGNGGVGAGKIMTPKIYVFLNRC